MPLLGNLLQLDTGRLHLILERWAREFGPIFAFRVVGRPIVVIADAELIQRILRDRPDGYRRQAIMRELMLELGIDGLFNAEGADWRRHRKLAMHALNTDHLREFFGRLEQVTARLQRRWERAAGRQRVDAQRDLMRFTVDVTTGLAFGRDLNTLEQTGDVIQTHLEKIFPALVRRLFAPFAYWRYVRLPSDRARRRRGRSAQTRERDHPEAREPLAREPERLARPTNLLEAILVAQAEGSQFTDAEIAGNALTILLAGEDTTANTLAWMMHFMVGTPRSRRACRPKPIACSAAPSAPPTTRSPNRCA